MHRHHFPAHAQPVGGNAGRHLIPATHRFAAHPPGKQRIGNGTTAEHDVGATGRLLAVAKILDGPHLAVGNERNVDGRTNPVDPFPTRRRAVAVDLRPAMHDQFIDAGGGKRLGVLHCPAGVVDTEPHLGGERNARRHHGPHGRCNFVQQFRLTEQGGTAAMAVHRRRRATEIEIDPGRIQRHQPAGVFRHHQRIGTQQLHAHRRSRRRLAAVEQFRTNLLKNPGRQHVVRNAHKLADAPVVAANRRQHAAQQIVGEPFHRGEKNAGHAGSGAGIEEAGIIIRAMLRFVLDTNVVLDLFHWANTDAVPIMAALEAGRIECFADERTLDELQRVLTYPQLKMTPEMIVERYARYSGLITMVEPGEAPKLPRCKDRDDQKFLELAARCGANVLVSKDKALLRLRGRTTLGFQILKPGAASALLAQK